MLTLPKSRAMIQRQEAASICLWTSHPVLWSLWDVVKLKLDRLVTIARILEGLSSANLKQVVEVSRYGPKSLGSMALELREFGLTISADHAMEIVEIFEEYEKQLAAKDLTDKEKESITTAELDKLTKEHGELANLVRRELKRKVAISLTEADAAELFENARPFDSEKVSVNDRFPDAVYDIQEAANCKALSRPTACVFHLMRVLEVGLNALATDLNVPWPSRNDWQDVINAIEGKIKLFEKGSGDLPPDWREKRQFYADAATQFTHIKDGWRNYAMHFHAIYDETKADIIYRSVREFMRVLAIRLSSSD